MDELMQSILGPSPIHEGITVTQMVLRAAVVYLGGLVLVRVGKKRLLGRTTAFDIILAFLLGSLLSRAINGGAALVPSFVAAAVLITLHWGFALMTFYFDRLDRLFKGTVIELVQSGEVQAEGLRQAKVSRRDLQEALRLRGRVDDPAEVAIACLERNGEISVVRRRR
jgi:uncharacterized membrane protein YcaP (DUF421 family)